jgi:hypothetical protein
MAALAKAFWRSAEYSGVQGFAIEPLAGADGDRGADQ